MNAQREQYEHRKQQEVRGKVPRIQEVETAKDNGAQYDETDPREGEQRYDGFPRKRE